MPYRKFSYFIQNASTNGSFTVSSRKFFIQIEDIIQKLNSISTAEVVSTINAKTYLSKFTIQIFVYDEVLIFFILVFIHQTCHLYPVWAVRSLGSIWKGILTFFSDHFRFIILIPHRVPNSFVLSFSFLPLSSFLSH